MAKNNAQPETETPVERLRLFLGHGTTDIGQDGESQLAQLWDDIDKYTANLPFEARKTAGSQNDTLRRLKTRCLDETEGHQQSRNVVNKTIRVLEKFNSIASDAASSVFPGASACFNGLAILIAGIKNYTSLPDEIDRLAEACLHGLQNIKDSFVNTGLAIKIHRRFALIVQICCECAKASSSRSFLVKRAIEKTFGDDEIQDLMSELDELRRDQMEFVVNDLHRASFSNDAERRWRRILARFLDFHPGVLDQNEEPTKSGLGMIYKRPFENTGKWIHHHDSIQAWQGGSSTVCLLAAPKGYGKTYLMASIASRLPPTGTRGLVAFHFQGQAQEMQALDSAGLLRQVVRSIIWQCATSYLPLLKSMASIIQEHDDLWDDPVDAWLKLLVDNSHRKRMNRELFILIDSSTIGISAFQPLVQALNDCGDRNIRLLFTVDSDDISTFSKTKMDLTIVEVSQHSMSDIEIYANSRMNRMNYLGRCSHQTVQAYRKRIVKELQEKSEGDWATVTTLMDRIEMSESNPTKIDEVLGGLVDSRGKTTAILVAELNQDLDTDQIAEVNEAMLWIMHGFRLWTPGEMDQILFLAFRKDWFASFQDRMKSYPIFDVNIAGLLTWRSPGIPDYIPKRKATDLDRDMEVLSAEIDIVKHFLRQVCPDPLFQKLGLDGYLEEKRHGTIKSQGLSLCLEEPNAHIRLALVCLRIITLGSTTESLIEYAGKNVLRHLECTDLAQAGPDLKRQAGPLLVKLFTATKALELMFWIDEKKGGLAMWTSGEGRGQQEWLHAIRDDWLCSDRGGNLLSAWFKDPFVTAEITGSGKELVSAFSNSSENRYELLFGRAADYVTMEGYHRGESREGLITAVQFLTAFIRRINPLPEDNQGKPEQHATRQPALEEWLKIEKWILETPAVAGQKEELYKRRGRAFALANSACALDILMQLEPIASNKENAARARDERVKEALGLWPHLHMALRIRLRHEKGLATAKDLTQVVISQIEKAQNKTCVTSRISIASLLNDMGNRYWDMGKDYQEKAIATYHDAWARGCPIDSDLERSLKNINTLANNGRIFAHYLQQMLRTFDMWKPHIDMALVRFFGTSIFVELAKKCMAHIEARSIIDELLTKGWRWASEQGDLRTEYFFKLRYAEIFIRLVRRLPMYGGNIADVIDLLEEVLEGATFQSQKFLTCQPAKSIYSILAELYLRQTLVERQSKYWGERFSSFIQKHIQESSPLVSCCFARYNLMKKKIPQAKEAVRELVTMALDMLSDNDPSNDAQAFSLILLVMITFGDIQNAKIIVRVLNLIKRSWWTATQEQANQIDVGQADTASLHYSCAWCDQDYKFQSIDRSSYYICVDCVGTVMVHPTCYAMWQLLPRHKQVCEGHQFLYFPEMHVKPLPNTLVPGETSNIPFKEWKEGLRRKYLED